METLRSVPVHQVKAALKKVEPKERNLLFAALPGSQVKSILGSLPAGVLAPWEPPAPSPPPAPTGGPPASILTTTYQNVPYSARGKGSELVAEVQRGFDDRAHLAASVGMGVGL